MLSLWKGIARDRYDHFNIELLCSLTVECHVIVFCFHTDELPLEILKCEVKGTSEWGYLGVSGEACSLGHACQRYICCCEMLDI